MTKSILEIGYNKYGEEDFGVSGLICDLSFEQMNKFRAMAMVAIGTAEDMWRRANSAKHQTCSENKLSPDK